MDFALTDEQEMVVDTVRAFTERELVPHEEEVERLGDVRPELVAQIRDRALDAGIYAANMPADLGGGGLDNLTMALVDRAFGWTQYALHYVVARPSNILQACVGDQIEEYLLPTIRGERVDCLAMSEPDAGSDVRGMTCRAVRDGDDYVINGTKHFISHADLADYTILFAATGEEETPRGPKKLITSFLVDHDTPGLEIADGYRSVSNRGYNNCILNFDDCRVSASAVLGEEHRGFEVANEWLGATRLQVASVCLGRADRAMAVALDWAASREQFGQKIGKFQGVSFKLADMATEIEASELLLHKAASDKMLGKNVTKIGAMAKMYASEACVKIASEAVQIHGGYGFTKDFPVEKFYRDAKLCTIGEGTTEIQKLVISRDILKN